MKDQIVSSFPMKILCTVFKIAKSFEKYTYCHTHYPVTVQTVIMVLNCNATLLILISIE